MQARVAWESHNGLYGKRNSGISTAREIRISGNPAAGIETLMQRASLECVDSYHSLVTEDLQNGVDFDASDSRSVH